MKVLERKEWAKTVTCTGRGNGGKGCGSVLEIERADLRFFEGSGGDSWGSSEPAVMFKCCVCGAANDLEDDDYPVNHTDLPKAYASWYKSGLEGDSQDGVR